MKHRRIMRINKIMKGSFGAFKGVFIYEYSEILKEWIGYPEKWYERRAS